MRPKVIQKKTSIEMLQFAFLQLVKRLELEKHLSSILLLWFTVKHLRLVYLTLLDTTLAV